MMPQPQSTKTNPIVIKKYANRRLYNTDTSSYVTLDDLCQMIKQGEEIVVYDAKNGDDITRSVLTQIIVEQENKGQSLLPTGFLRQLISFYGGNMQGLVPRYLEYSMQAFSKNQDQMSDVMRKAMGGMFSFSTFEEMSKQNMALFEQAMRMFSPFSPGGNAGAQSSSSAARAPEAPSPAAFMSTMAAHLRTVPTPGAALQEESDEDSESEDAPADENQNENQEEDESIRQMKQRLDDLQKQIASLSKEEGGEG
jgi:polyhydroxyalkanoate synthesis repressor PhaR